MKNHKLAKTKLPVKELIKPFEQIMLFYKLLCMSNLCAKITALNMDGHTRLHLKKNPAFFFFSDTEYLLFIIFLTGSCNVKENLLYDKVFYIHM